MITKKKKLAIFILVIGIAVLVISIYLSLTARTSISNYVMDDQWVVEHMPENVSYDYLIGGPYCYLLYNAGSADTPDVRGVIMQRDQNGEAIISTPDDAGNVLIGVKNIWIRNSTPTGEDYAISLVNLGNNAMFINVSEDYGFEVYDNYGLLHKMKIDGLSATNWVSITPTIPSDFVIAGEYNGQTFEIINGNKIRSEMWWMMG